MIMPDLSRGACREVDTELFFPDDARSHALEAKKVCAGCPVKTECAEYAMEYGVVGVWGGTTWLERERTRTKPAVMLQASDFLPELMSTVVKISDDHLAEMEDYYYSQRRPPRWVDMAEQFGFAPEAIRQSFKNRGRAA